MCLGFISDNAQLLFHSFSTTTTTLINPQKPSIQLYTHFSACSALLSQPTAFSPAYFCCF